jgi:hypothetical protein
MTDKVFHLRPHQPSAYDIALAIALNDSKRATVARDCWAVAALAGWFVAGMILVVALTIR